MTKGERLTEIVKCCERQFNRGEAIAWKHSDFVDLNREILLATDTNISPSTLKRIFGKVSVDQDYIPQQATLSALEQYGSYIAQEKTITPIPAVTPTDATATNSVRSDTFGTLLLFIALAIGIAGLFWSLLQKKKVKAAIMMTRTEGTLPATASFDLQTPETDDSLFVNFGDKTPPVYLIPGEYTTAHIYFFPGVFSVSIQTRRDTMAITNATIASNKWTAFAFHRQEEIPANFYEFQPVKNGADSLFQITNSKMAQLGLDTNRPILTRLCNYTTAGHKTENFVFETTFRNALEEKGIYCRSTQFQISGTKGLIRFKFVRSGCSLRVLNIVSEKRFKGTTNNLSQFVLDLGQWNSVKLVNQNKQVFLSVNGKQIFTGSYEQSLGDINGLFLEFEGTGTVKSCDLKSSDGNLLFHF